MSKLGLLFLVLVGACAPEFVPPPIEPLPDKVGIDGVEKKLDAQANMNVPFQTMEAYGFSGPRVYASHPILQRGYSHSKCPTDPGIKFSNLIDLAASLHGEECSVDTHLDKDEHGIHRWMIAECHDSMETVLTIFQEQHPPDYVEQAVIGYTDPIAKKRCVWMTTLRVGNRPIVDVGTTLRAPSR